MAYVHDDFDSAMYMIRRRMPNKVYHWIEENLEALAVLHGDCKERMSEMGCPVLDKMSFLQFVSMVVGFGVWPAAQNTHP